ncbi:MAG: hypothetical protein Q7O66_22200 [Dehalococcoidia bacterium]|nr:hypothetical protein [Dehalococcoidia bacterium]
MIKRTALSLKNLGTHHWWEAGQIWRFLKLKRVTIAANAAVVVPLVAVGLWAYVIQERNIVKLRIINESLAAQIAKKAAKGRNRREGPRRDVNADIAGNSDTIRLNGQTQQTARSG